MGALSTYMLDALLDHLFNITPYTPATHLYIALSTADFTVNGSGAAEPSGNNYARKQFDTWHRTTNVTSNNGLVSFNKASGSWGTIGYYAIFDALTNGNMIAYGTISDPQAVVANQTAQFVTDDFTFTMAGAASDYLRGKLLDHVFKITPYTAPTTFYVALSTANPTSSGGSIAEPVGNNYSRTSLTAWTRVGGSVSNTSLFVGPTASGSWGTITYLALFDALTTGNMLTFGTAGSNAFVANDYPNYPAGNLIATLV